MGVVIIIFAVWITSFSTIHSSQVCKIVQITDHFPTDWQVKIEQPKYPKVAKDAKIQGVVQVQVFVDQAGNVKKACIIQGHPLLQTAALKAAMNCKFKKNFGLDTESTNQTKTRLVADRIEFEFKLSN